MESKKKDGAQEEMPTTSKSLQASFPLTNSLNAGDGHVISNYPINHYLNVPVEPQAQKGPLPQVLKILFLSCLPCLIVLIRSSFDLADNVEAIGEATQMQTHVLRSLDIVNVVHATQLERGSTIIYISSGRDPNTTERMQQSYAETDFSFSKLPRWVATETDGTRFRSLDEVLGVIRNFRQSLNDPNISISIYQALDFYSKIIAPLIGTLAENLQHNVSSRVWNELVAYHQLTLSKEQAGAERALGCTYYTQDDFHVMQYHERLVLGKTYMKNSMQYASLVTLMLNEKYKDSHLERRIERLRTDIIYGQGKETSVSACESWFDTMSQYIELLKEVQYKVGNDIIKKTRAEIGNRHQRQPMHISIIILAVSLVAIVAMEMYLLNRKAFRYACHLLQYSDDIENQRIQSQQLVLKALPEVVATELLLGNRVLPQRHPSVSIMFTEIVEFSELVMHVKSEDLVDFIDAVVIAFDERLELYKVHKMEMMGGTTMIASGFQNRGYIDVFEIADAAKDLMTTLSEVTVTLGDTTESGMKLRIGINTGPVVTGLVGNKLPRYSVFGDTVNTASRMTSTASPGMIQLTDATRLCLKTSDSYRLELRGTLSIKGKGDMTTYMLLISSEDRSSVSDDYRQFPASRSGSSRVAKPTSGAESSPQPFFEDTNSTFRHLSETINCRLPYV